VILDSVKQLHHPNILHCIHYMMKDKELVMITELITAGSIREYCLPLLICVI
jgi:Protein tyrosine and serine/threonine kinase